MSSSASLLSLGDFFSIPPPPCSPGGVLHLTQALSSGPQTQHPSCSLLLPLLFSDLAPPPLPLWLGGSIPSCGLLHVSGICLGQRLRVRLTVNRSVHSVPSLWQTLREYSCFCPPGALCSGRPQVVSGVNIRFIYCTGPRVGQVKLVANEKSLEKKSPKGQDLAQ